MTDTIRSYFTGNPDADKFHFTSDEQAFSRDKDANEHAKELKRRGQDETVTIVTRAEAFAEKAPVGPTPLELAQNALGKAEGKVVKFQSKVDVARTAKKDADTELAGLAGDAKPNVRTKAEQKVAKAAEALKKAEEELIPILAEARLAARAVEELKGGA